MILPNPYLLQKFRDSIENKTMTHNRCKSLGNQKTITLQRIGSSLTNRYHKKFRQITSQMNRQKFIQQKIGYNKDRSQRLQIIDLGHHVQQPKFVIKRKYLSFEQGCNNNDKQKYKCKNKIKNAYSMRNKFDYLINQYCSNDLLHKKECQKQIREGSGQYNNNINANCKPKYKCIFIKKMRQKINLNPQLSCQVKAKQRKISQEQSMQQNKKYFDANENKQQSKNCLNFSSNVFSKRPRFMTWNQSEKKQEGLQKPKIKTQKKVFRPWSGYESDDTL